MANLLKTFSSSIDIVDGPVHQIFPEPNILSRTSVVEDYKVISLVANESFAVVITISNNGELVDLTGPTDDEMNASVFDDTSADTVELAVSHDAGLSDLANGVIAFICPVDTLPSTFANSFNRKPLGTVEIDFKITVGGHTTYIYDRVNVIDNAFGGTGAVLPVSATQFVSKAEIVDTSADEVQLGVRGHSTQTANIFEVQDDSETVTGGFDENGLAFGLKQTEISDVVRLYTKQQNFGEATLTDAANISWALDDEQTAVVTLTDNRTLDDPTNMVAGGKYELRVIQDGVGSRTLAYGTAYKFPSGVAPTLSTGIGAIDVIKFTSDGASMFGTFYGDFS